MQGAQVGSMAPKRRYPEAVSYTHLDVYKRQLQHRAPRPNSGRGRGAIDSSETTRLVIWRPRFGPQPVHAGDPAPFVRFDDILHHSHRRPTAVFGGFRPLPERMAWGVRMSSRMRPRLGPEARFDGSRRRQFGRKWKGTPNGKGEDGGPQEEARRRTGIGRRSRPDFSGRRTKRGASASPTAEVRRPGLRA